MILLGILVSIITFGIIILVHEFGHFKASRIFKVKVEEFGLGIPPRAKKLFSDKHGTIFSLNWIPLGGFVRLKGENINTFRIYDENQKILSNIQALEDIKNSKNIYDIDGNIVPKDVLVEIEKKLKENFDKDSLQNVGFFAQSCIILAGVFMNFLLAFLIFSILFFVGVKPIGINGTIPTNLDLKMIPTLEKSLEIGLIKENTGVYLVPTTDSIAQKAGVKENDLVLKVNDNYIKTYTEFKDIISKNKNKEVVLKIKRIKNGCNPDIAKCIYANIELKITPGNDGKIGSYLVPNYEKNEDFEYKYGIIDSLKYGLIETKNEIFFTYDGIKLLLRKIIAPKTQTERQEAINEVSGPIGMVDFMSKTIGNGLVFIIVIGAMISINLGVFNLLPIPALDGGRFLLIAINGLIQKIFGKKAISEKTESIIHGTFFIFLIALSIIIAYNDVIKIFFK